MAIKTPEQTAALLADAGAVEAKPRLNLGLVVWKDDEGRPVASARCEAILTLTDNELVWAAEDPKMKAQGVPAVLIPTGLPPRQPKLPPIAARGMAQLALKDSSAELIIEHRTDDGLLFMAVFRFAPGPTLTARTPTEEVPKSMAVALEQAEPGPPPAELDILDLRMEVGPQQQIIAITLEAKDGWMDTGLDPVKLATRPLLLDFEARMLWVVEGQPAVQPRPHLAFRHMADGSNAPKPRVRYAPSPTDPPVPDSGRVQPLGPTNRLRFPATPGRIEVKVLHVDSTHRVRGYQGYLRIMAMMRRAGPKDLPPHKLTIDKVRTTNYEPGFDTPEELPDPEGAQLVTIKEEW